MLWGWSYPYRLSFFIIEESKMKKIKVAGNVLKMKRINLTLKTCMAHLP
jgi:hypothetical protein